MSLLNPLPLLLLTRLVQAYVGHTFYGFSTLLPVVACYRSCGTVVPYYSCRTYSCCDKNNAGRVSPQYTVIVYVLFCTVGYNAVRVLIQYTRNCSRTGLQIFNTQYSDKQFTVFNTLSYGFSRFHYTSLITMPYGFVRLLILSTDNVFPNANTGTQEKE